MKRVAVISYKENWVDDEDDDFMAAKAAVLGEEHRWFLVKLQRSC